MAIEDLKIQSESWTWQRNDPVLLIQVTLLLSPTKTTYIRDLLCNTYYRDVGTMWSIHSETCHPLQCEVCLVLNVDHRCHGIGPLSICSANAICLEHFPIQLYLHLCAFAWVCAYLCWADLNCCGIFFEGYPKHLEGYPKHAFGGCGGDRYAKDKSTAKQKVYWTSKLMSSH